MRHKALPAVKMSLPIMIPKTMIRKSILGFIALFSGIVLVLQAQPDKTTVRGRVEIIGQQEKGNATHQTFPGTVIWLTPISGTQDLTAASPVLPATGNPRLVQRN